jgi:hypothetical protein
MRAPAPVKRADGMCDPIPVGSELHAIQRRTSPASGHLRGHMLPSTLRVRQPHFAWIRLSRIHAVGPRLTNGTGDHRMVCRAGAGRRATAHWGYGSPTSGGPTSDCIVTAKDLVFPNSHDPPAHLPQHAVDESVRRPVGLNICPPECRVVFRPDEMPRAPMPVATIHEHRHLQLQKNKVRIHLELGPPPFPVPSLRSRICSLPPWFGSLVLVTWNLILVRSSPRHHPAAWPSLRPSLAPI